MDHSEVWPEHINRSSGGLNIKLEARQLSRKVNLVNYRDPPE